MMESLKFTLERGLELLAESPLEIPPGTQEWDKSLRASGWRVWGRFPQAQLSNQQQYDFAQVAVTVWLNEEKRDLWFFDMWGSEEGLVNVFAYDSAAALEFIRRYVSPLAQASSLSLVLDGVLEFLDALLDPKVGAAVVRRRVEQAQRQAEWIARRKESTP
jgi:hypothetical protein